MGIQCPASLATAVVIKFGVLFSREERKLKVFEVTILRNCIMKSFIIARKVKSRRMRRIARMLETRNAYKISVGKPERILTHRLKSNSKMHL
jgi:hypothetical protein